MATSDVDITEGSGTKVATHTISEDAVTKHIQRVALNESDGSSVDIATETTLGNIEDRIGSTSSSAPAGDATTGVGLNGRLIRIASNITNLSNGIPLLDGVGGSPVTWTTQGINTEDASDPVVITSDQMALDAVALADGSASGLNGILLDTETKGYRWITAQCTATGSGNTIRFEGTNDDTNWSTVASINNTDGSAVWTSAHGPSANASYSAPVTHKRMRIRISAAGSGTVTVKPVLFNTTLKPPMVDSVSPKLTTRTTDLSAGSNGTPTTPIIDAIGKQVIVPYSLQASMWGYAAGSSGIVNTTTAVTIKTAAGSGIRNYITSMQIMAETLGTATELAIRDGAGGTVLWRIKIPTTGLALQNVVFPVPLVGTANTLLEVVTLTASGTGAVYFNAQGYVGP